MVNELKIALENLEEKKEGLLYTLDVLETYVGYQTYSNVAKEIDLVATLYQRIDRYIMGQVELLEGLNLSLDSILSVELGLNKTQTEDDDEIPF